VSHLTEVVKIDQTNVRRLDKFSDYGWRLEAGCFTQIGHPVVMGFIAFCVSFRRSTSSTNQLVTIHLYYPEEIRAMNSPLVLCIDDLPPALELRKATLESQGYCVKTASSGHTAMKVLEDAPVDAVLLEFKQEGMDAEAVAWHIKQRFPNLPIILLSAYSEMPERICGWWMTM
jgi:CheY-like chemotaxis protein